MSDETRGLGKAVLTKEQMKAIREVLNDLRRKAQLDLVLLIDVSGQAIAYGARNRESMVESVSALVAGNFAAALELSRLLGEEGFRCLYHEGQERSVYACKVGEGFIILVVFHSDVRFGLVKLYLAKGASRLEEILKDVRFEVEEEGEEEVEMPSDDELDALLKKLKEEFTGGE